MYVVRVITARKHKGGKHNCTTLKNILKVKYSLGTFVNKYVFAH